MLAEIDARPILEPPLDGVEEVAALPRSQSIFDLLGSLPALPCDEIDVLGHVREELGRLPALSTARWPSNLTIINDCCACLTGFL